MKENIIVIIFSAIALLGPAAVLLWYMNTIV